MGGRGWKKWPRGHTGCAGSLWMVFFIRPPPASLLSGFSSCFSPFSQGHQAHGASGHLTPKCLDRRSTNLFLSCLGPEDCRCSINLPIPPPAECKIRGHCQRYPAVGFSRWNCSLGIFRAPGASHLACFSLEAPILRQTGIAVLGREAGCSTCRSVFLTGAWPSPGSHGTGLPT